MKSTELDLHGQTWTEALATFEAECQWQLARSNGSPVTIRVIHGYGSTGQGGVIKDRLRAFCARFPEHLNATAGEKLDGNAGITHVTVSGSFPDEIERLAEEIHRYCNRGRTTGEIDGRFRRHGKPRVAQATALLKRQGRLARRRNDRGRSVNVAQ